MLNCFCSVAMPNISPVVHLIQMVRTDLLDLQNSTYLATEGVLVSDKDRRVYELRLERGGRYVISAANLDLGENIRLVLKDFDGRVLEQVDGVNGSEDPVIDYRASGTGPVRLIVKAESDSDNRGEIPFALSVRSQDPSDDVSQGSVDIDLPGLDFLGYDETLSRLFDRLADDGISLSDLDRLVASTTADGSRVSQSELDSLSRIALNLDRFVDDPALADYYSYVFSAAVGANLANRYWTGGVQDRDDRIELGNLEVGSSRKQVEYLRRKWFRGEDLPLARIDGDSANDTPPFEFSYSVASGPVFDGDINFDQVAQGRAGTCYFLAGLMSVAHSQPDLIKAMFVDNQDGTYGVRFFGLNGGDAWVTVNRDLPIANDSLLLAGSYRNAQEVKSPETNELWAALAEKALAQVNETGVLRRAISENSYQSIEGGDGEALDYITGRRSVIAKPQLMEEIGFDDVRDAVIDGRSVWLGSDVVWSSSPERAQLVEGHAYSVIGYESDVNAFLIANPWGFEAGRSYDPVFGIPSDELYKLYRNELVDFAAV